MYKIYANTSEDINDFVKIISNSNVFIDKDNIRHVNKEINSSNFYIYYDYYDQNNLKTENNVLAKFQIINDSFNNVLLNLKEKLVGTEYDIIEEYLNINPHNNPDSLEKMYPDVVKILVDNMDKTNNVVCTAKLFKYDIDKDILLEKFNYKDENDPKEYEKKISILLDISKKNIPIGYRYYKNYNVFGNSLITINNREEISIVNCGVPTQNPLTSISDSINRKLYADKPGILISGKKGGSYDYLSVLNEKCKNEIGNKCCILPIIEQKEILTITNYSDLNTKFNLINRTNEGKKIALLPIGTSDHISIIIINLENQNQFHSFDSSLAHRDPRDRDRLNEEIFGDYLINNTQFLINKVNLQSNGTCTYWSDAFCEVVVTSPEYNGSNGEDGLENIKRDCENGTMFLKCAQKIGRIFEENMKLPAIKIYKKNQKINNNYYNFTINGKNYGISKTSGLNKFVNLETLVETLGTEEEKRNGIMSLPDEQGKKEKIKDLLKNQIEGQKKIGEKEREIFNFEQLEKTKKAYEDFVNKEIESTNSKINNTLCFRFFKIQRLRNKRRNLYIEKDNFCREFDECKRLYGSVDDWKNEYNELKEKVRRNESIITNSTGLDTKINNLVKKIQKFKVMKDNEYDFNFCSEADEVVNTEEVRTINEIEQLPETRETKKIYEAELNRTINKEQTEIRPTIPNVEITSSFSNITATNIKNPINSRSPTSPNNSNNTEKQCFGSQYKH